MDGSHNGSIRRMQPAITLNKLGSFENVRVFWVSKAVFVSGTVFGWLAAQREYYAKNQ